MTPQGNPERDDSVEIPAPLVERWHRLRAEMDVCEKAILEQAVANGLGREEEGIEALLGMHGL